MARQPINLVIISLATVHEQDTARLQSILHEAPDTKVFTIAPAQRGAGLATLLRAQSLEVRHFLAKPLDPHQLRTIFELTFPQPAQQDWAASCCHTASISLKLMVTLCSLRPEAIADGGLA